MEGAGLLEKAVRHLIHKDFYMTIKDIARLAKVSTTTVSRVLNKKSGVGIESKRKILAVIEQFSYQPNPYAQRLAVKSNYANICGFDMFLEQLEKQGMPKHCGLCYKFSECTKQVSEEFCHWLKRYRSRKNNL